MAFLKWSVVLAAPLNRNVTRLEHISHELNPYSATTTHSERDSFSPPSRSWAATFIVVAACVTIAGLSALDQHRERYGPTLPLSLFAATPVVPAAIIVAMARRCRTSIWTACLLAATIVSLFGLATHSVFAFQSTPREYIDSAGQMHIFILPILHIAIACVIYATLAIAIVVIRSNETRPSDG